MQSFLVVFKEGRSSESDGGEPDVGPSRPGQSQCHWLHSDWGVHGGRGEVSSNSFKISPDVFQHSNNKIIFKIFPFQNRPKFPFFFQFFFKNFQFSVDLFLVTISKFSLKLSLIPVWRYFTPAWRTEKSVSWTPSSQRRADSRPSCWLRGWRRRRLTWWPPRT